MGLTHGTGNSIDASTTGLVKERRQVGKKSQ